MPGLRHRVVGSHEKFVRVGGAVEPRPDRAGVRARREDASEPAQARHQASTEEGKFSSEEKKKKKNTFHVLSKRRWPWVGKRATIRTRKWGGDEIESIDGRGRIDIISDLGLGGIPIPKLERNK